MGTILPSSVAGPVTHEVGYLQRGPTQIADWLRDGLGRCWAVRPAAWDSLARAAADLAPAVPLTRYAVIRSGPGRCY